MMWLPQVALHLEGLPPTPFPCRRLHRCRQLEFHRSIANDGQSLHEGEGLEQVYYHRPCRPQLYPVRLPTFTLAFTSIASHTVLEHFYCAFSILISS